MISQFDTKLSISDMLWNLHEVILIFFYLFLQFSININLFSCLEIIFRLKQNLRSLGLAPAESLTAVTSSAFVLFALPSPSRGQLSNGLLSVWCKEIKIMEGEVRPLLDPPINPMFVLPWDPLRAKKSGILILASVTLERLAYYAVVMNLFLYLNKGQPEVFNVCVGFNSK